MLRASVLDGFLAGTMIAIGGSVLLSCDNRYLGAALFTVALLSICLFGFNLYTGKVGFLVKEHSRDKLAVTFSGLLGNILGTLIMGLLVGIALPKLVDSASAACVNRLGQTGLQTLIRGFFCGILMYTAVWVYREKGKIVGILFCVPVFILAGFEHSIADMFYFFLARSFGADSFSFLTIVVLANSLGGVFIPFIQALKGKASV